jgi:hypothetical protein
MEPPTELPEQPPQVARTEGVTLYENPRQAIGPEQYPAPQPGRQPPAYIPPGTPVEIARHGDVVAPPPAPPTYVTPETPYQAVTPVVPVTTARAARFWRRENIIYVVLSILETLLAIRLFLKLLGANPDAAFSALIYGLTYPFVLPFSGVFPDAQARGSIFELSTLLALLVYPIIAWIIVRILRAGPGRGASLTA